VSQPLIDIQNVSKSFGGARALTDVSLQVLPGEVHALCGENGAGKSTLIKIITGAHQPDSGVIAINGTVVDRIDPSLSRARGIAAIYQQPALFPDLTVAENISLRLERGGPWRLLRWGERRRRARALLDRIGATIHVDEPVRHLTMPQQQLVEIASALAGDAKVLILDEPTASLSDREVENLFRVVRELRSQGVGMIYISHRMEELSEIADRVTVLRDGKHVATLPMQGLTRSELIRLMVGRELSAVFPKNEVPLGDIILETRNLSCRQSGVHDISLTLRGGEILGLAGLVGAGRTELARTLFGLTPADDGQILLRGRPVVIDHPARAVELGIGYVPEDRRRHGVILEMSVAANTTLAVLRKIATGGWLKFAKEREIAYSFVQRLGIKTASLASPVGTLSGGNQQKVALARWLATDPSIIILDEPTQGVDVGAKSEIHRLMGELASRGMAILMISSELPEILGMSDRIAVMHDGGIVAQLDRAEATQEKILELALGHVTARHGGRMSAIPHAGPPSRTIGKGGGFFSRYLRETSVAAAYLSLLLLLAIFHSAFFYSQFRITWVSSAPILVAAIGMTLVILSRHIDISIGSQFSVCGIVAGTLAASGLPLPGVIVGTLVAGALLGAVNGVLVAGMGLPSIVVTLATMVVLRGALMWSTDGAAVRFPPGFQWFGVSRPVGQTIILLAALAVFAAFAWGLRWLAAGRMVYAVGSDQDAARLAGIHPKRVVFVVFVLMGTLTALAALFNAAQFVMVYPNVGEGLELQVIAAVVVGGTAISGGRGTLVGTLIGVALLGTIGPALQFFHMQSQWAKAIAGGIILLAVASDALARRAD